MAKYLLEDIFNKYMSYRTDSKEIQDIDRNGFEKYLNKSMDRSYYSDSHAKYAKDFLDVFNNTFNDQSKLEDIVEKSPEFVKEYMRNCIAGMQFKDTFNLPMNFRKLLVNLIDKDYFFLMLEKVEDFDELYEAMYDRINSGNNKVAPSPEAKKAEVLRAIYEGRVSERLESKHTRQMSFKQLMEIYLPFNISRKVLAEQDGWHYHKEFTTAVYRHLEECLDPEKSKALKEWNQLSESDREFLGQMIRIHKNHSIGEYCGYEDVNTFEFFKKFKSLDVLESYTFKLSSSTEWWKDKSVLGNIFAVWYACKKGQVPKYVANKFGKFKPLLNLYKYNWEEIRKLIMKDKEVLEALQ